MLESFDELFPNDAYLLLSGDQQTGGVALGDVALSQMPLDLADYDPAEADADAILVAGTNARDGIYYVHQSDGTRFGSRIDVCAPSFLCPLATNTGDSDYIVTNGTSFGTAYVSGVVACLLQGQTPLTTRAQVQAIRTHVRDTTSTAGRIVNSVSISAQLPDRFIYLDPVQTAPETIAGL